MKLAAKRLMGGWERCVLCLPLLAAVFAVSAPAQSPAARFDTLAGAAGEARAANRRNEAADLYRQALRLRPSWAEGWWSLGTLLYDQDDYSGAAAALRKATALNPAAGRGWAMLGLCEAKLGREQAAMEHIDKGWKLGIGSDPEMARVVLFTRANLLLDAGRFGEAQDVLGKLARDGAGEEELILALGLSVLGLKPDALASADTASRSVIRRAGWAEHLSARGRFQAAEVEYSTLAGSAPKFHNVQFAYGRFLLAHQENDRAVAAFQREIENTPNHLLARLGIAGIKHLSDPAAGLPYAEQAVKLAPALPEAHYLLGLLLADTGDAARAIPELETARRGAPEESKIYLALSRAYAAAGRKDDARRARATLERLSRSGEQDAARQGQVQ